MRFLLYFALLVGSPGWVMAQDPSEDSAPAAEVSLAAASGFPGGELTIPLYLAVNAAQEVGGFRFDLYFPSSKLSFREAAAGFLLKAIDVPLEAELLDAESGHLQVRVNGNGAAIPPSMIGYLVFSVQDGVELGELPFQSEDFSFETTSQTPIPSAKVSIHKLSLIDPDSIPIVACFFYLH